MIIWFPYSQPWEKTIIPNRNINSQGVSGNTWIVSWLVLLECFYILKHHTIMSRTNRVEFWLIPYKPEFLKEYEDWYFQVVDLQSPFLLYENLYIRQNKSVWGMFEVFEVESDGWHRILWISWKSFQDAVTGYQQNVRHHMVSKDPMVEFVAVYYGNELDAITREKDIVAELHDAVDAINRNQQSQESTKNKNGGSETSHQLQRPQSSQFNCNIIICVTIEDLPHEVATLELTSSKPFTKLHLDQFIQSENFQKTINDALEWDLKGMQIQVFTIIKDL